MNMQLRSLVVLVALFGFSFSVSAQKFYTKNGLLSFFSNTAFENIKADNNQVTSVLNTQTGELQFSLLNNAFHFKKALMEEHFNEDYMESKTYPKSSFKGSITNIKNVNFSKDGVYPVMVTGELSLHGVTKKISTTANISLKDGKISGAAKFSITLADYQIKIDDTVKDSIAKTIEITVSCLYDQKL